MSGSQTPNYSEKMIDIFAALLIQMDEVPGWREWQQGKLQFTLNHDDPSYKSAEIGIAREFLFPIELENRHAVVMQYFELRKAVENFKNIQYYFRRYPFGDLPITYNEHLTFVCEAFFSKFYEIRGRIKNTLNALNRLDPANDQRLGEIIKLYDKAFDFELRQRNRIAHHAVFEDVELSRLSLAETLSMAPKNLGKWRPETQQEYRSIARGWVKRVRRKSEYLAQFVELVEKRIVNSGKLPAATKEQKDQFFNATRAQHRDKKI